LGLVITGLGIRQTWVFIFIISMVATALMYLIYYFDWGRKRV